MSLSKRLLDVMRADEERQLLEREYHDKQISCATRKRKTVIANRRQAKRVAHLQALRETQQPRIILTGLGVVPRPRFALTARHCN